MSESLTWQEAKRQAQSMEDEIVSRIPAAMVEGVSQNDSGTLLQCGDGERQWNWNGSSTVTIVGEDSDAVVEAVPESYAADDVEIFADVDSFGLQRIQLLGPGMSENYIVSGGFEPNEVRVVSGSACFTLPEDVWPRGEF